MLTQAEVALRAGLLAAKAPGTPVPPVDPRNAVSATYNHYYLALKKGETAALDQAD